MALLGLFAKRDKKDKASSKSSAASQADTSSVAETSEYVLPDIGVPAMPNQVYGHGSAEASSSKFHLGFRKRSTPASDVAEPNLLRPPHMPSPSSRSEADLDAFRPPLKSNLFGDANHTLSTRSLPNHSDQPSGAQEMQDGATKRSSTELPSAPKKQGGLFSWAHRERKKSKPTDAAPSLSVDVNTESFNLKSFRHVRPESPSPDSSLAGSPSLAPPVIPRPRGNSVASDSSQRISVAAFREMAARRSAANSPTPSPVLLRPPSRSDSLENAQLRPTSTFQRAPVAHRGSTLALGNDSSSSESEDSGESESEESAGSSTMRPKRQRTITQKTRARASTELGHISRPAPMPMPSSSKSALGHGEDALGSDQPQRPPPGGFFRNRASKSASALHPDAAARRASQMAADEKEKAKVVAPAPVKQQRPYVKVLNQPRSKSRVRDSDSDDSNSSSDDSDDAPLATFMRPPRPGSAASSNASRTRTPTKPLIDINALGATPPPVPSLPRSERPSPAPSVPEKLPTPPAMDRDSGGSSSSDMRSGSRPTHEAKPSLSDRLARIAQGAGAKSVEQLASVSPIERRSLDARPTLTTAESHERERHHPPPPRSQTAPLGSFDDRAGSPSPSTSRPRPSPNAAAAYDLTDPKPIIPTPIRERSPPPAFTVTSRPPSQLSLNRLSNSQATVKLISSPSSSPTTSLYMGAASSTSSGPTVLTDSPVSMSKPPPFTFIPPIKTTLPPTPPASNPSSARPSPGGRQRSSTLVPTGSFDSTAGFTGGGLLASPASADTKHGSGAHKQSQPQSAMRGGRARSSTMLPQMDVSPAPRMENQSTASSSGSSRMPPSTSSASATSVSVSASSQQQNAAHRHPQRARPPFSGSPSSAGSMSSLQQPSKPFAVTERGNSPASSTGDSSSGRTPLTPADGSDLGVRESRSAVGARKGHRRGPSVTFEDEDNERGRPGAKAANDEERRKERRRSEAKAAIELPQLGKVVNGKITLEDDDEEDMPLNSLGPRMSMAANPMMNFTPPTPVTPWGASPGASPMMGAPPFLMQPPNADPRFLAAHQHAMMVAKQAYQMAVAQQAMAAANEEWERGSSVSAFGGGMNMNMGMNMGGMPGMGPMAGMGMPGMLPGGYGMGFNPMMFSSAQTMYAGSTAGSELGVGWGSRSEYGGPARNSRTSAAYSSRQSQFGLSPDKRSESSGNVAGAGSTRPSPRPRTKTSPADAPLPREHARNRQGPPPSSFKGL